MRTNEIRAALEKDLKALRTMPLGICADNLRQLPALTHTAGQGSPAVAARYLYDLFERRLHPWIDATLVHSGVEWRNLDIDSRMRALAGEVMEDEADAPSVRTMYRWSELGMPLLLDRLMRFDPLAAHVQIDVIQVKRSDSVVTFDIDLHLYEYVGKLPQPPLVGIAGLTNSAVLALDVASCFEGERDALHLREPIRNDLALPVATQCTWIMPFPPTFNTTFSGFDNDIVCSTVSTMNTVSIGLYLPEHHGQLRQLAHTIGATVDDFGNARLVTLDGNELASPAQGAE